MSNQLLNVEFNGELTIGGLSLPCYVLENGQRVLSGRGVQSLLKLSDDSESTQTPGSRLKRLLNYKSFKPFFTNNLDPDQFKAIICKKGKTIIHGYDPTLLVDLCDAIIEVRNSGATLTDRQKTIAKQAEIFIRSVAKVGIIALIDEATGYQNFRARTALREILEKFIAKELRPWVKTFPDEFYEHYFRLRNWKYKDAKSSRPSIVGKDTNDVIYARLAPIVLDELKKKTPRDEKGKLKHHFHRLLTEDIGHPKLKEHISNVIILMRASSSWKGFIKLLDKAIPRFGATYELPFDED